jgi:hypothetical protein
MQTDTHTHLESTLVSGLGLQFGQQTLGHSDVLRGPVVGAAPTAIDPYTIVVGVEVELNHVHESVRPPIFVATTLVESHDCFNGIVGVTVVKPMTEIVPRMGHGS